MSDDPAFYGLALRRIDRLAIVLGAVFVAGVLISKGWRDALGCAVGAGLSFVNLRLWHRVANAVSPGAPAPVSGSAVPMALRTLLLGTLIFVIIKYFEVSLVAVLAGLLVSVAAVILEILYELIFSSHSA